MAWIANVKLFGVSVCVMCPALHLEPGVVRAYSSPTIGILDLGAYPSGVGESASSVSAALRAAGFVSEVRADIMRWKYRKLLQNLSNVIEAACGPQERHGKLSERATAEGETCLRAADIAYVSENDDAVRRGDLLQMYAVAGEPRPGGSSWQSLKRSTGTIETDFLNGEIVLLGRLFGVPTPVNERLQRLGQELARGHARPASISMSELLQQMPPT
jgi:2-dehydropantoate 2-reductase